MALALGHPAAVVRAPPSRLDLLGPLGLLTALVSLPVALVGLGSIMGTGLRQLAGPAEEVDFVAFYTGARLLLTDPARLYDAAAWQAVQAGLHGQALPVLEFWNPPHAALMLAPLAELPFGVAYLVWLVANVTCLAAAGWLLAPRGDQGGARPWWIPWAVGVPLFMPVQLGLIMGQMSGALLLGFAVFVRLAGRSGWVASGLALLPWTWKPQLLPALLLMLGLRGAWRTLLLVCLAPLLACGLFGLLAGPSVLVSYAQLAAGAGTGVLGAAGPQSHLDPGQSLLGLAQWLVGPGTLATGLAVAGSMGLGLVVALAWRGGLRADPRRYLQLALLPLAATLGAPHALAYDATTWLASAWLALSFAAERPRARPLVVALLLLGWWAGNLAALPRLSTLAPWGALGGLGCLAGLMWLYACAERAASW